MTWWNRKAKECSLFFFYQTLNLHFFYFSCNRNTCIVWHEKKWIILWYRTQASLFSPADVTSWFSFLTPPSLTSLCWMSFSLRYMNRHSLRQSDKSQKSFSCCYAPEPAFLGLPSGGQYASSREHTMRRLQPSALHRTVLGRGLGSKYGRLGGGSFVWLGICFWFHVCAGIGAGSSPLSPYPPPPYIPFLSTRCSSGDRI